MTFLRKTTTVMLVLAFATVLLVGCGKSETKSAPEAADTAATNEETATPVIYTTFYPTTYFTKRIADDLVDVVCPVPPDADPIFWQPDREAIAAYQAADLIIVNGAEFEKWVLTATLPANRIVDTAADLSDEYITFKSTTHAHGMAGEHTHEGIDGHTWVDSINAKEQADVIREALIRLLPDQESVLNANYQALINDLDELNNRLEAVTPGVSEAVVLCSHPAYNYLAKRYGWDVHSLDLDPEATLTDEQLKAIEDHVVAEDRTHIMLWEGKPLDETRELLRTGFGIASVFFSPVELLDPELAEDGEDYLTIMNANIDRLEAALK